MSLWFEKYLISVVMVVSILSASFVSSSCSSQRAAAVSDSSTQQKTTQKFHVVAHGDTLYSIAWRYGLDYHSLAAVNRIKPPYLIHSGQKIRIDLVASKANIYPSKTISSAQLRNKNPQPNSPRAKSAYQNRESGNRSVIKTSPANPYANNTFQQSTLKWQWPAYGRLLAAFQGAVGSNKGIDIEGKLGESVIAAAAGQVVYSGSGLRGYGNLLILKHNEIFLSAYAHNNKLLVKEGDFVKAGQRIADMGLSGTDRVKLHFEIRSEGKPVDPQKYLPVR
ncbi:MAG: peptidoglycan DD-metalloendopeptidase family protein [Pseudomonadota bacterium]